ncbi:MAG TPA: glycosyltransferase family 4 protein [Gammaproteobacteria bacterium]|nr:glycosyltransferase family 4 protein [Gammaproteobacteria bacterium]
MHLTTVHRRNDTRIRFRETATLAGRKEGCRLVVADGLGGERAEHFDIHDLGVPKGGRIGRAAFGSLRALRYLWKLKPEVLHFHDPELIPLGLLLSVLGFRVIYDVHEDVPRQILDKYWLPLPVRQPMSWLMSALEWLGGRLFAAIVTATPTIAERFPGSKTVVVQNFPILSELSVPQAAVPYSKRPPHFAYIGSITRVRGIEEIIHALGLLRAGYDARLRLAGDFAPRELQQEMQALPGWHHTDYLKWINREQAASLLGSVRAGLVVLYPIKNYPDAYPVKMFEYMSAGLPVIASDFPLWRSIVEGNACGLLVDPLDPKAIARAMQWLLEHPQEAEAMGRRGREAVEQRYTWESEKKKLLNLYSELLQ